MPGTFLTSGTSDAEEGTVWKATYVRVSTPMGYRDYNLAELTVVDGCLVVTREGSVHGMFSPPWQVTT